MIVFYNAPEKVVFFQEELKIWITERIVSKSFKVGELSFAFLTNEEIKRVNNKFLQHNYPTDVITFNYTESNVLNAEIYIGWETVMENSEEHGTKYADEMDRVIIHGVLHCIGYNDKSIKEAELMRNEEDNSLLLRAKNLINR